HALNALVGSIDTAGGVLVQRFPTLAPWPDAPLPATASLAQLRLDEVTADPFAALSAEALAARLGSADPYPVNLLFLLNTNPVYERPAGGKMAEALLKVPFVVSFASVPDETAAHADLILPASTFLETWGDDFIEGTGYAGVSLRQPVVAPVHDTRDPGDVLLALAKALGGNVAQALPFPNYRALCEYRLSAIDTDWDKVRENGVWSELVYFHAQPGSRAWSQVVGRDRLHAPRDGRFDFYSRELYAVMAGETDMAAVDTACLPHFRVPVESGDANRYPFLLVTQGLITHPRPWTGILPTLQECYGLQSNMKWRTWVEMNPRAARPLGIRDGDLVWVESPTGRVRAVVRLYEGLWPNAVYLPPGLGHRTTIHWGRGSQAPAVIGANVNQLLAGEGVTRVRITRG
ncbi:MAG: molybdopterin dinucleotide binding domain-containing protein, partial [Anaerolineae bacterium]